MKHFRPVNYGRGVQFNAVLILIGINILFFIAQQLFPRFTGYVSLNVILVLGSDFYWQFLSYMFAHGGMSHLFFNMLALFIFGTQVERRMGSREFLIYYLLTGLLAGVFSFIVFYVTGEYWVQLLGASGAIFAVQLAFAVFYPDSIIYIMGILPVRAPFMVLGFTALEIFETLTGFNSSVAHLTHLAGFAFGWLYIRLRFKISPLRALLGR
ncbi:rhomboid family intramembrane serine protease [Breznakiellaceae bacterium SP9]